MPSKALSLPRGNGPGRPAKFDEPIVPRRFGLPASLDRKVRAYAQKTGGDDVDVVRDALNAFLSGEQSEPRVASSDITASREELHATIKEAITEALQANLLLRIEEAERAIAEELASRLGMDSVEILTAALLQAAVDAPPSEVAMFLKANESELTQARKKMQENSKAFQEAAAALRRQQNYDPQETGAQTRRRRAATG